MPIKIKHPFGTLIFTDDLLNTIKKIGSDSARDGVERSFSLCEEPSTGEVSHGEICIGNSCSVKFKRQCPEKTALIGHLHTHPYTTSDWSPGDIISLFEISYKGSPKIDCRYAPIQDRLQCETPEWLPTIPTEDKIYELYRPVAAFYDVINKTGEPPSDDFPPEFYELESMFKPVVKTILNKSLYIHTKKK